MWAAISGVTCVLPNTPNATSSPNGIRRTTLPKYVFPSGSSSFQRIRSNVTCAVAQPSKMNLRPVTENTRGNCVCAGPFGVA